ncbi:MAG TPA: hypothetical protein VKZ99_09565 [Gammaproteobacteria bacterium]|nr:hypothetical protein [Gammaproteobacteria bacterium]
MRPITVLNGIVLGSCGSIFLGIAVTLLIFVLLGPENPSLQRELGPLTLYALIFLGLTLLSALAFVGQLLLKPWRWWAQAVMLAAATAAVWYLLP